MSRPHAINETGALAPDVTAHLYVARSDVARAWRLLWARPGADSYCYAEGECSARYFRTMRDAVAYGARHYGETARKWRGYGWDFD